MEFDTMYLIDAKNQNKKLPIKLNPKINSFKTIIQEQKMETIGGKYPVFFRNGNVRYKEIGISGLISYWMTEPGEFMPEEDIFNVEAMPLYSRIDTNSKDTTDYIGRSTNLTDENIKAEHKFREEVEQWLTNGQPKIFDSPTEGRHLVRLMNVSLSPNETLGRMLYTFSCTAYECGVPPEVTV